MEKLKQELLSKILILLLVVILLGCNNRSEGTFEKILDNYIKHNNLTNKNYLMVNTNRWSDSTSIIVLEYRFINRDKLNLPKIYYKSSYKNIDVYCINNSSDSLPIHNNLNFEKQISKEVTEVKFEASNEYFNELQFEYYPKGKQILNILLDNSNGYFKKKFIDEGLMPTAPARIR